MKKLSNRICLLAVQLAVAFSTFAQTGQVTNRNLLDPSTIPEELKKDANSVVRRFENSFELINPGKGLYKEARTITILNKAGSGDLQFVFVVDKFRSLEEFKVKFYDSNGKLIGKYDKKDLRTSAAGGGAFVDDNKILYLALSAASYPVTVESESVEKYLGLLNPPEFRFQSFQQGVENAVVRITYPADINLEFKSFNLTEKPTVNQVDKTKSYEWKFNNLKPIYYETSSWSWEYNVPRIIFHSDKFEMDDFPGNLSTWKDLGIWYNNVIADRNKLSEANKNAIRKLVEGVYDNREKVRIVYKYLQDNFRYVNIALGIGGWRPFPADFVHEKKYGDCKGLSNYMQACLSAINVKAYYAVVNAGSNEKALDPSFSYRGFNHIIVCVPMEKDSIWLECTSSTNDFGVLGNFTENRNALLVTPEGGKLVATPRSRAIDNKTSAFTKVTLTEDGSGQIEYTLSSTGMFKEEQIDISKLTSDQQKLIIVDRLGFSNPDEYSLSFSVRDYKPFETKIGLVVEKLPDFIAGSKMFIKPRMYKFWSEKLPNASNRVFDYLLDFPLQKTDTTVFALPEGYVVETLPLSKDHKFCFGEYSSKSWFDEKNRLVYSIASLSVNDYRIPPEKFAETKAFFDKVIDAENQKLIIKKL